MSRSGVLLERKVRLIGSYHPDRPLNTDIIKDIVDHASNKDGAKIKLQLTTIGLQIGKSFFQPKVHAQDSYVPISQIVELTKTGLSPTLLLCIATDSATAKNRVVAYRCSSEHDVNDFVDKYNGFKQKQNEILIPHFKSDVKVHNGPTFLGKAQSGSWSQRSQINGTTLTSKHANTINGTSVSYPIVNGAVQPISAKKEKPKTPSFRKSALKTSHAASGEKPEPLYAEIKKDRKTKSNDVHNKSISDNNVHDIHEDNRIETTVAHGNTNSVDAVGHATIQEENKKLKGDLENVNQELKEIKDLLKKSMGLEISDHDKSNESLRDVQNFHINNDSGDVTDGPELHSNVVNTVHEETRQQKMSTLPKYAESTLPRNREETLTRRTSDKRLEGEARILAPNFQYAPTYTRKVHVPIVVPPARHQSMRHAGRDVHDSRPASSMNTFGPYNPITNTSSAPVSRNNTFRHETQPVYKQTSGKVSFDPSTLDRRKKSKIVRASTGDTVIKPIERVYAPNTHSNQVTSPRAVIYAPVPTSARNYSTIDRRQQYELRRSAGHHEHRDDAHRRHMSDSADIHRKEIKVEHYS